jgi:hypothetical protein
MRRSTSFRLEASEAAQQAHTSSDPKERLRLLKAAHYWISAAENEDWLLNESMHRDKPRNAD